jgi:hypothetical protein
MLNGMFNGKPPLHPSRGWLTKKEAEKPPCRHPELHFTRGGLYVVCSNKECGDMWRAVLKPAGIVVNPGARAQGLTEHDVRRKP